MADHPDLALTAARVSQVEVDLNGYWKLFGATYVFFMQSGYAMMEAGAVRSKNTQLFKNVMDACLGCIVWWVVGYPLAYGVKGKNANGFIGGRDFLLSDDEFGEKGTNPNDHNYGNYWSEWFFSWAFAASAATVVSGAVAERCRFRAYAIYTCAITGFIYPVVVHWVWSSDGWLSGTKVPVTLAANGVIDLSGSGVVNLTGGSAALMATYFLGPRIGKFSASGQPNDIKGHSTPLSALGAFILWFSWYGFNCTSTPRFVGMMAVSEKVAVVTSLAPSAAAISALFTLMIVKRNREASLDAMLNGIISGLVSITAGASVIEPWAAVVVGLIAGCLQVIFGKVIIEGWLHIDDPTDAVSVNGVNGFFGLLVPGLLGTHHNTATAYGVSPNDYGLLYGGGWKQFGMQLLAAVAITAWTCTCNGMLFYTLARFKLLRVSPEREIKGFDALHHGGAAYRMAVLESRLTSRHGSEHGGIAVPSSAAQGTDEGNRKLGGVRTVLCWRMVRRPFRKHGAASKRAQQQQEQQEQQQAAPAGSKDLLASRPSGDLMLGRSPGSARTSPDVSRPPFERRWNSMEMRRLSLDVPAAVPESVTPGEGSVGHTKLGGVSDGRKDTGQEDGRR
eukprot:jgi/Mesvir1/4573/Mv21427-RA.4